MLTVENGSTAHAILQRAREVDPVNYSFETRYYPGLGHMLIALDGVEQYPENNKYWMMYTADAGNPNGTRTQVGIDLFKPEPGTSLIFKYEQNPGCVD